MAKNNIHLVSEDAKKNLNGITIKTKEDSDKYSKRRYVQVYKGYDFLGNFLVVRNYIQKHYGIDLQLLELLLKLMEMRVFTVKDYTSLPKDFSYSRFNTAREKGFIQVLQNNQSVANETFCLSTRAQNIVTNFYQMLSGEKEVPTDRRNPMAKKKGQKAFDKKKMALIDKLNATPTPEHIKRLYG